jgi:type IV pilus assembly protein PilY1
MNIKKLILLTIILLMIYKPGISWDDQVLFSSSGSYSILKPNIMILLSNNRTMNNLIYHKDFDPNTSYPDYIEGIVPERYHRIVEFKAGSYYNRQTGVYEIFKKGHYLTYWVNDSSMTAEALEKQNTTHIIEVTPTEHDGVFLLDFSGINASANPIYLFGEPDGGNDVLIDGEFLNFMIYSATDEQRAAWNHFQLYGTWDTSITANIDSDYGMAFKTRMRVARKVMTETSNTIYADAADDPAYPRVGLSEFSADEGLHMTHPCQQQSSATSMASMIKSILADADAPISEAFAEVWSYFRLGGTPDITNAQQFKPFPDCGPVSSSPISNWCQLNFIVVVTDGLPTKDTQLRDLPEGTLFYINPEDNSAPWGDIDGDADDDDSLTTSEDGTYYLDDIAAFAYREDLYPDEIESIKNDDDFELVYQNKQFIYTYVIGYNADDPLLAKTAENGGGEYFVAENYETLTKAMKDVMSSIDEKVRSYAAFAAPKYSLTYGDRRGYVATFVPRANSATWEGHLKCYLLDENGFFPEDLDNAGNMFLWDAGVVLNERSAARNIYTEHSGNLISFDTSASDTELPPLAFGFNSGDPTLDLANRDKVIDYYHGNNPLNWRLGDIFHFGPLVVGAPLKWKGAMDASYQDFFDKFTETKTITKTNGETETVIVSKRTEVVYAGANDGMLHCFRVTDGEELWSFMPRSFLGKLKNSVDGIAATPVHQYFVDGKAMVTDIKIGTSGTWEDWKTILVFGMGIGGKSYVALDVTDPNTPKFLWEFDDPGWMGNTEGKPVVARIAHDGGASPKQVPAVFLSGGFDQSESEASKNTEGKAFYVLHAYYGYPIKEFKYGAMTTDPDPKIMSSYWRHSNSGFTYNFVARPTIEPHPVTGLAKTLFMSESGYYTGTKGAGARIWRIDLQAPPLKWRPELIFQADDEQTIFIAPTMGYDKAFNLWLYFGTGHRPNPNDPNNVTGQLFGMKIDNAISTPYVTSDFLNITGLFDGTSTVDQFSLDPNASNYYKGFYLNFVSGDREIMFDPSPLLMNKQIIFNTYKPTGAAAKKENPCVPQGNQAVYTFGIDTSGGTVSISDPEVQGGKIQGHGSLGSGKYNIYIGDEEAGSTAIKSQQTVDVTDAFGILFWTEKKK